VAGRREQRGAHLVGLGDGFGGRRGLCQAALFHRHRGLSGEGTEYPALVSGQRVAPQCQAEPTPDVHVHVGLFRPGRRRGPGRSHDRPCAGRSASAGVCCSGRALQQRYGGHAE